MTYNVTPNHFYPLTADAKDSVGTLHGTPTNVTFSTTGATFPGNGFIELPRSQDFSATKTGGLTIALYLAITDWKGAGASEYFHWMGKGESGAHEWTMRAYVDGGTGEAAQRQGRVSFYSFNPAGGLGAGSYYQDSTEPKTERFFVFTLNATTISLWMNGVKRDSDPLSGYNIKQSYTQAPVRIGTRDKSTGFLKGRVRAVGFWNRVLSDSEITNLKLGTTPTPPVVTPPVVTPPTTQPVLTKAQLDAVVKKLTELT